MSRLHAGLLPASEPVLAPVCGPPEPKRSRRLIMPLRAYVDESGAGQPPVLILAGGVSSAARWASFADSFIG